MSQWVVEAGCHIVMGDHFICVLDLFSCGKVSCVHSSKKKKAVSIKSVLNPKRLFFAQKCGWGGGQRGCQHLCCFRVLRLCSGIWALTGSTQHRVFCMHLTIHPYLPLSSANLSPVSTLLNLHSPLISSDVSLQPVSHPYWQFEDSKTHFNLPPLYHQCLIKWKTCTVTCLS